MRPAVLVAVLVLALAAVSAAEPARPNVLFIAVDDLRTELGCYGVERVRSPNIDTLAAGGTTFIRAYCPVAVCGASRAALLTGLRPTPSRFLGFDTWKDQDAPDALSLPAHFKANGYVTASIGKVYHHQKDDLAAWSVAPWRATQESFGYQDPATVVALAEARKAAFDQAKAEGKTVKPGKGPRGPATECFDAPDDQYADGMNATKAIAEIERLKDQPFFLAVGFHKPHLPFVAPKKYWDLYPAEEVATAPNPFVPKDAPPEAIHHWGELRAYCDIPGKGPLPEGKDRELVHGYLASVSFTDAQIGRVLAKLDELGLAENTIVVLWGDHGWNLGEHTLWCKHCNFHNAMNAPLIVRAPGKMAGQTTRALTEFVDIYPTLCDLAGLPQPAHLEGTSFVPLLDNPARSWKNAAFSRYLKGDSIITDRYVYSTFRQENGAGALLGEMLYDHETDPQENVNLVGQPDYAAVAEDLRARMQTGWIAALPPAE